MCATLAWLAEDAGWLFECYYAAAAAGTHFGGGHPASSSLTELRGGLLTGGHHLEQLYRVLLGFDCHAAVLGPNPFGQVLAEAGVPLLAVADDVAGFYRQVLAAFGGGSPQGLLAVGDGGSPQGVGLAAYAYPEIVNRRLVAVADQDPGAVAALGQGLVLSTLWSRLPAGPGIESLDPGRGLEIAGRTLAMAARWRDWGRGYALGDPELVGRWTPSLVRERRLPLFGVPQSKVIDLAGAELRGQPVVLGRQQDDVDFLALSRAGVAFQLIDPGRPPLPVVKELPRAAPLAAPASPTEPGGPSDPQLERWAADGRVLSSLVFWTGMIREVENLYALADVLSLTGLAAGLALTVDSFEYMPHPPLSLVGVPAAIGGLAPRVEALLASTGNGALLESEAPPDRFAGLLTGSMRRLRALLGEGSRAITGWWGVMDAPFVPVRPPRVSRLPEPPYVQLRYQGRGPQPAAPAPDLGGAPHAGAIPALTRSGLRGLVRTSPLTSMLEAWRPFDGFAPGPPGLSVLESVRAAGFDYALTKSGFAGPPAVTEGVDGLTILNYTAGRWDGWTPFATVNSLADLQGAERRLLRGGRPGWLLGTIDSCLWAFSGPRWDRGADLRRMCSWMAGGGDSGQMVNVPPAVVARYARLLGERDLVRHNQAV